MNRIKELRLSNNLSQAQLAQYLGVNQTAVGKYERGELEPNISTLCKLADIFSCSIDYLLGISDDLGAPVPSNNTITLPADEAQLLLDYRNLSEPLKKLLRGMIDTWKHNASSQNPKKKA